MKAIVFSGGSTLGPAQVGAVRAILERNIKPDILVGCSSGALNAAYLAQEVSLSGVEQLAQLWRDVRLRDIYPGNGLTAFWRFMMGYDGFFDNQTYYTFLQRLGIRSSLTFKQLKEIKLYITATQLHTGRLRVFGDNLSEHPLDALMASTALPPFHPPWEVQGQPYMDGGIVTPMPLRVAINRGATEIYALRLVEDNSVYGREKLVKGVFSVMTRGFCLTMQQQVEHDLLLAKIGKVKLHNINLCIENAPDPLDFSQADRLIESGYQQTQAYLNHRPARPRTRTPSRQYPLQPWSPPVGGAIGLSV